MKVVSKGDFMNDSICAFFHKNVLPILEYGIAFEKSRSCITVYQKKEVGCDIYTDPTAEIFVELSHEVILLSKNLNTVLSYLKEQAGDFYDEALAIREIERLDPGFSREYYSCSYTFGKCKIT